MATRLYRPISEPIRVGLSWSETWQGPDKGLIWCWELGRRQRSEEPELAACTENGELVTIGWKGGVEKKLKVDKKPGTLNYLATWQGLRGENLDIAIDEERVIVCARTGQAVGFSAKLILEEE